MKIVARRRSRRSSICSSSATLDEAIALHNVVDQGCRRHLHDERVAAETFLSAVGATAGSRT
jgi:hypothetical protein